MSNRGKNKFLPFDSLHGFRNAINEAENAYNNRIFPKEFTEQEMLEINNLLFSSQNKKMVLHFELLKSGKLSTMDGYVKEIVNKTIYLDRQRTINFEELFSIKR